jgi:formylglycine-generating enzyme required for sulfatase activity
MSTDDLGRLKSLEWRRLQDVADRFQAACRGGDLVDLAYFLPPSEDPLRATALHELVVTDLEMRWQRQQGVGLEHYLEMYPELGTAETVSPRLVYEEYIIRQRFGDKPALESYQQRFPEQFEQLRRRVESHGGGTSLVSTPSGPAAPLSDTQVVPTAGGYKLIERIGSGSYGEVWRAEAPGGFLAAVKIISRPVEHEDRQREKASLALIRDLRHRCLVQTHQFWENGDRLYIAMELADSSLRDRADACRAQGQDAMPREELLTYIRDTAEGLDYLHSQKGTRDALQHRDIKPENILLLEGHAKVADFGLARRVQESMRATGEGTPLYMAPEVWRNEVSRSSDQYSLAMVYGELRLGRRLLQGRNMWDLAREVQEGTPNLEPLPKPEQDVILKALSKDPTKRYPSCLQFVGQLEEVAKPPTPGQPGRRRLPSAALPLFILFMIVAMPAVHIAYRRWFAPPVKPASTFTLEALQPLMLNSGAEQTFSLRIQRDHFQEPVHLTFAGLPQHVHIDQTDIPGDADSVELHAKADRETGSLTTRVEVSAEGGDLHQATVLSLTVLWVPEGYEPVGTATEEDLQHNPYYIQLKGQGAERAGVEFVLVLKKRPADPDTFYMMVDKVSAGLYRRFAAKAGSKIRPCRDDVGVECPALGVYVDDAYQCALWLGGNLPTTRQWDKAAGLFDQEGRLGPFRGTWKRNMPLPGVAIQLREPRPVGTSGDDVSVFRCRDMAGNGLEWTRTMNDDNTVPIADPPKDARVFQRGQDYHFKEPLLFANIDQAVLEYVRTDAVVGFRVVLEPPGTAAP